MTLKSQYPSVLENLDKNYKKIKIGCKDHLSPGSEEAAF